MRKRLKVSLLILALLFLVIQLFRPLRNNPPVDSAREFSAFHRTPSAVASMLQRACSDCHSNRTVWPWYSNVAPASWVIAHDVKDGRRVLNLSEWDAYNLDKREKLIGKMCEEVKDGEMPMSQYTVLHPHARLDASEIQALCSWTQQIAPQNEEAGEESD
jgi:heme-binding protein